MATTHNYEGSTGDQAFKVETHGIDFIPESERWAKPRDIGAMWAGSSINVEYFIYGALLMGFGFKFTTALVLIVLGNLSFFLVGLASLQGRTTGTTAFAISRAPFGTEGSKLVAFFNWITQVGFETEGLILIVGAVMVLFSMGGVHISKGVEVLFVIIAAAIQAIVPYFGHATMVKVLRSLIIPFGLIFVLLAYFDIKHGSFHYAGDGYANGWTTFTAGLAFTITLSGLGWTECGNDYTRYLPADASPRQTVGWIFLGTAVPEIIMMTLGALTFTFLNSSAQVGDWNGANPFTAMQGTHYIPSWVLAIFLVFSIVQLFGINSLDLYSSGVSMQAMGIKLKRYQAVILDSVLAGALTIWATLGSTFSLYMKEFVGVIILWVAPWFGIFIVDYFLRKGRYSASELQNTTAGSLYYGQGGFNWNAIVALIAGMVTATLFFSKAPPPVNFPFHWMTPLSNHFGGACAGNLVKGSCTAGWYGGADFSIFIGIGVAGLLYFVLDAVTKTTKRQLAATK